MTKKSKLVKECMVISLSMALAAQVVPVGFSIFANEENPETVIPSTTVDKTESEGTTEVETEDTDIDAGMNMDVDTEVSGMLAGILDDLTNGEDVDKTGIKETIENIRFLASQYPEGSFSQATLDKLEQAELLVKDNTTTDGADKGDGEAGGNTGTDDLTVPFDYSDGKWQNLSLIDAKRVEEERAWLEAHGGSLSAEEYSKLDAELKQAEGMIDGLKQSLITERYEGIGKKVEEATINAEMTQEQVNDIMNSYEVVYVEAGDYGLGDTTHIKLIVTNDNQVINMEPGEYTRLTIINEAANTIVKAENVTVDGQVSDVGNRSPFIYVPTGSLTLYGNVKVTDHDYGVMVGYTDASNDDNAEFTLGDGATLDISGCTSDDREGAESYENSNISDGINYSSNLEAYGKGTYGSAIVTRGHGNIIINFNPNSTLNANHNSNSGMYAIYANVEVNANHAEVHFDYNEQGINLNTDSVKQFIFNIKNGSTVTCDHNNIIGKSGNGIVASGDNVFPDGKLTGTLVIESGSTLSASNNDCDSTEGSGIINFNVIVNNASLIANENGGAGFAYGGLNANNAEINLDNNRCQGAFIRRLNINENFNSIIDSKVSASGNGYSGLEIEQIIGEKRMLIKNSTIIANNNGYSSELDESRSSGTATYNYAGIANIGNLEIENSSIVSNGSAVAYSLWSKAKYAGVLSILKIDGTNVVALNGDSESGLNFDLFDENGSAEGNFGRTYVIGGSLQASIKKIHGSYTKWNEKLSAENEQYSGPINSQGTKLVRFDLNREVNKVVHGDDVNNFTYYDPNTNGEVNYTFRYNELGEDLNEGESDNAYVWAPVSIVNYNATQGKIANKGTAGTELTLGSSVATGDPSGQQTATDITIYGNSLALAEKRLPSASRSGYTFSGWYVVDEGKEAEAEALAAAGNYTELYKLLNTRFYDTSKVATDLTNGEEAQSEITVYAKWSVYDPSRPDPTPGPDTTDPTELSDPDTEIPDEETPETGGDKPGEPGSEEETIDEEQTPEAGNKDEVPNTGVKSTLPWVAAFILSAVAIIAELLRKRKA